MAKKKNTQTAASQEEHVQAQQLFGHYHQIAHDLHESKDEQQTEAVLAEINTMSEGAQIALLKELAKEHHVDAADVLVALHELSPLKSIRKEARRSLIQLEGARIYPTWEPDRTPAISLLLPKTNPPRFWKGHVTGTRAMGQVQLFLFWEQGEDYKEVRILGFFLDFEYNGVKDFFTAIDSKRGIDKFTARIAAEEPDLPMRDCTLGQGRRLLLEALEVHEQDGSKLPFEYQSHISLINQLIIDVPDLDEDTDLEEEEEDSIDLHGLTPTQVVVNFVEFWVDENYGVAYDLLASDSPLREGLSRDEWIERRETWASEAVPDALEPNFLFEREQPKSRIWLPTLWSINYSATHKEIETGWSIELDEIPEGDLLPELPQATIIYEETNRHWFWVSYSLIQEDGEWRIQQMTDEGVSAQGLSIEELQERSEGLDSDMEEFAKKYTAEEVKQLPEEEALKYAGELVMRIIQATCYTDVLIKKLPLDYSLYADAAGRMVSLGQYERCLAYLVPLTQRFPQDRALYLRRMADVQQTLSGKYFDKDYDERGELYQDLAEQSLRESLAIEDDFEAHMALVEILIDDNERLDEAEDHLLKAKDLMTDSDQEAHVERHLGEIALEREQFQEAFSHYQRVLELQPDSAEALFDIGEAYEKLGHFDEAEANYKHALELEPDGVGGYYRLSRLYSENDQPSKAIEAIEQGIAANPDSAILHLYLAAIYIERDDYHQAEIWLDKAEELDPESPLVAGYRQILKFSQPKPQTPKLSKAKKRGR